LFHLIAIQLFNYLILPISGASSAGSRIFFYIQPNLNLLPMTTEFILHLKEHTLNKAKTYAALQGHSLEALIEEYLFHLAEKMESEDLEPSALRALLLTAQNEQDIPPDRDAKKDYRRYLIEKHQ
jgi:hypothetical protein